MRGVPTGLWITGSRFALAGAAVAAALALAFRARTLSWKRTAPAALAIAAVLTAGWLAIVPHTQRYSAMSVSVRTRLMMAEASLRLFRAAPVFGIGIDQLYDASADVVDPGFQALSGYSHQNAHNNFLQALAELGVVGLAAMLWWLGTLAFGAWRARSASDSRRDALGLGLLACVGTWLAGHPLLLREFSTTFWLYAAILAALVPPLCGARDGRPPRLRPCSLSRCPCERRP